MRRRKRKKRTARAVAISVIALAALAALIALACSRVLIVRDIMVVGNRSLTREQVVMQSGISPGQSLLSITASRLKERLEQNRYIEYLGYEFDYRGTLTIRINERMGMAVVNVLGIYYVTDTSGMVLECTGSAYPAGVAGPTVVAAINPNTRVIIGEKLPVSDPGQLADMRILIEEADRLNVLRFISAIDVQNPDNLYMMTAGGTKIEIGASTNVRTKLFIAREVLTKRENEGDLQGAKIDVSNGRNAHFIPAVLPTPTPVPTAEPTPGPDPTPEP